MTEETKPQAQGHEPDPPSDPPSGPAPKVPPPGGQMVKRPDSAFAPIGERGILLRTFEELRQFARVAVDGGAAPQGMNAGGAAMAIQAGLERGLGPLGGLQYCTVINGNLSWNAQGVLALLRTSPLCKPGTVIVWTEGEGEEIKGIAVAHRVHYAEPFRAEFSWQDAKQAGLLKRSTKYPNKPTNYEKYPKRMFKARAIGFLARDGFSDVLGGFPVAEEAEEFEPRSSGPAVVVDSSPPPSSGPDPVMEALKGRTVIEVEAKNPGESRPEFEPGEIIDVGTPEELEAEARAIAARQAEPPVRFDLVIGEDPDDTQEIPPTMREKLGLPPLEHSPQGQSAAQPSATYTDQGETVREAPKRPESASQDEDDQPTPPQGAEPITEDDRRKHREADAELAEQDGLFGGDK